MHGGKATVSKQKCTKAQGRTGELKWGGTRRGGGGGNQQTLSTTVGMKNDSRFVDEVSVAKRSMLFGMDGLSFPLLNLRGSFAATDTACLTLMCTRRNPLKRNGAFSSSSGWMII